MKRLLLLCTLCLLAAHACTPTADRRPLLCWSVAPDDAGWRHSLTLVNRSSTALEGPWVLYYGSIAPALRAADGAPVGAGMIRGSHHRIYSTDAFEPLAPGDSLQFVLTGPYVDLLSFYPEGAYLVQTDASGAERAPCDVELRFTPYHDRKAQAADPNYPTGERLYTANERFADPEPLGAYDILPSFKSVRTTEGQCTVTEAVTILSDEELADEAALLREQLRDWCGCRPAENGTPIRLALQPAPDAPDGAYRMEFDGQEIRLSAATPLGIAYAARSLVAVLAGKPLPATLPTAVIEDHPDLEHRGIMLDIARNFTPKKEILRLIDLLSLYKMSVLHLHLADDEGWRLEIPGLEELTEVGSRRGHTLTEEHFLAPLYGSGMNPGTPPGSGFLTRAEFLEILRYATARHIRILPEIDLPGHSRAAIKAMNARCARYAESDPERAEEYRLTDPADRSVYRSAQDYSDNVIDLGLASSYAFVRKVLGEVRKMYEEAGAPLPVFHIGGDEVPSGAWTGSPSSREFMLRHGLKDTHDLKNYFVKWLFDELAPAGIRLAGWQEIVMMPDGRTVDRTLPGDRMLSYAWSTLPYNGYDEITYSLADAGCPVILANVTNLYFDLAYSKHWMERGHRWGGFTDAVSSFDVLPYDIYKSLRRTTDGSPEALDALSRGKTPLHPEARANIAGMQGQLWAETIRTPQMVEYLLFPKLFGLAERSWNATPDWAAAPERYGAALKRYYARVSGVEMPRLAARGVNFRVTPPGLAIHDGMLYANAAEQGAVIRYTLDGSAPTENSPVWSAPVPCTAQQVRARAWVCGRASVISELFTE